MPAVSSVLPPSIILRTSGISSSAFASGLGRLHDDMSSVAEIKEKAKSSVSRVKDGSALSLINLARDQASFAVEREEAGDLRAAFAAAIKASSLAQLVFSTQEFKAEQVKKGALWREFIDFQQSIGNELIPRANKLEAKLSELEKSNDSGSPHDDDDGPIRKSIADRVRSLQDHGMAATTTKRLSAREHTISPLSPDTRLSPVTRAPSSQTVSSPPLTPSASSSSFSSVTSHNTGSSSHTYTAPSTLAPSSPSSPSSSSPRLAHYHVSDFAQAFPSIEEIEEAGSKSIPAQSSGGGIPDLPSVPNTKPGSTIRLPTLSSLTEASSRFPSIPLNLEPEARPASTPIPPISNVMSRPASPSRVRPAASSRQMGLPPTPRPTSKVSPTPSGDRHELPVTSSILPHTLHDYLDRAELKILLLDIRNRDDFELERIKNDAVVCLEPYVLNREGLTGERLEDSLSVAPRQESALFLNRDKFDLIVIYDEDSESFGRPGSPLSLVVRVIFENEFRRVLKKPPVILVGGMRAWKAAFPSDVIRNEKQETYTNGMNGTQSSHMNGNTYNDSSPRNEKVKYGLPSNPKSGLQPTYTGSGHAIPDVHHEIWTPRNTTGPAGINNYDPNAQTNGLDVYSRSHSDTARSQAPLDPAVSEERRASEIAEQPRSPRRLVKKPPIGRPPSSPAIAYASRSLYESGNGSQSPLAMNGSISYQPNGVASIQYPQAPQHQHHRSSFSVSLASPLGQNGLVSPPPQASINPSASSRRRDYIDQSEQAVSTFSSRSSIDYPELSSQHVLRPPPAVASPPSVRHDTRPRIGSLSLISNGPKPPIIQSDYPITYWPDRHIATSGLKNLGNTCYMNSTIQCLSATVPFARFFTDGRWKSAVNMMNPLGTKGHLTQAFASILHDMWHEELPYLTPLQFRRSICIFAKQFAGSEQHDAQEFLSFLLDGLHEDLNRVLQKPNYEVTPEREAELEVLPQQIASEQEWKIYRMRNDSIIVDFFQGQFRNRLECMTCRKTSTTYNTFMCLSLPIPSGRGVSRVTLQQCLDAFVQEEVMEKSDAWNCPHCKVLRKATKRLSLSRLPPILLIQLKRFSFKGPFTDKLETFVDFPLKSLDLTNYMPPPLPPNVDKRPSSPVSLDDPRAQLPPYRYDLYGVTNHFGTLSSGHYTAFVNSRGNWVYCDDSRITQADAKEVVGRPAYMLYYKRVKS